MILININMFDQTWRQLHKNAARNFEQVLEQNIWRKNLAVITQECCEQIEQVLETAPTKQHLYGHLPPITKTIKVRQTRHAGHCWRSRDELISDVLIWTPSHGCVKAGRPAWTYVQQLCEDVTLPEAMNNRQEWRERVRDIYADGTTRGWRWWWWCVWWENKKQLMFIRNQNKELTIQWQLNKLYWINYTIWRHNSTKLLVKRKKKLLI